MKLRLHRSAVREIDHEVDNYESRQAGLGAALEDEIDAALSYIARFQKRRLSGDSDLTAAWLGSTGFHS